jgi:hypothetical protein
MKNIHKIILTVAAIISIIIAVVNFASKPSIDGAIKVFDKADTAVQVFESADAAEAPRFDSLCNPDKWLHIYHPYRLHVYDSCITCTGTIMLMRQEKDGDWHIQLKPDSLLPNLLNLKNMKSQNKYLVLEIICANPVTQTDAISSCLNYSNDVTVPRPGDHVKVIGPWVNDQEHGWNEIHPVKTLTKIL